MKRTVSQFLFPLLLVLTTSCSSTYRLSIEVQEPASITLPLDVANVIVVNNSVPQPNSYGVDRIFDEREVKDFPLENDSVARLSQQTLSGMVADADFFSKVAVYHQGVRTDDEWLSLVPLSADFRAELFETTDADAIISIDRLLFNLVEKAKTTAQQSYFNDTQAFLDIRIDAKLSCSIFVKNRERALTSFTVSDSLFYKATIQADSTFLFKHLPEALFNELAYSIGEKAALYFTPSWKIADRLIYVGYDSRMKEAASYFKSNQWDKAEDTWASIYNDEKNPKDKARLATNMAVANEMQDQLDLAYSWAEKAGNFFQQTSASKNDNEIIQIEGYIEALQKRIRDKQLLDFQWGME